MELSVTFDDEHIYGSPFYPTVLPAPTASGHCVIAGEGRDVAVVGQTNEFTITAYDQWDDARGTHILLPLLVIVVTHSMGTFTHPITVKWRDAWPGYPFASAVRAV